MGLVSRGAWLVTTGVLVAGCGGSVADSDRRPVTTTTRAVPAQAQPFCAAVRANAEALAPLNNLSTRGTVPADQLATTVDAVRRSSQELLDTSPDLLRPDVQRTVSTLGVQLDALVAAGGDASVAARDPAVTAQTGSAEVVAAGRRVAGYVQENCRGAA